MKPRLQIPEIITSLNLLILLISTRKNTALDTSPAGFLIGALLAVAGSQLEDLKE